MQYQGSNRMQGKDLILYAIYLIPSHNGFFVWEKHLTVLRAYLLPLYLEIILGGDLGTTCNSRDQTRVMTKTVTARQVLYLLYCLFCSLHIINIFIYFN